MLYIMGIIVVFIIISSIFELGSGSSMTDGAISAILLGLSIGVWFIPSGNKSSSQASDE